MQPRLPRLEPRRVAHGAGGAAVGAVPASPLVEGDAACEAEAWEHAEVFILCDDLRWNEGMNT